MTSRPSPSSSTSEIGDTMSNDDTGLVLVSRVLWLSQEDEA